MSELAPSPRMVAKLVRAARAARRRAYAPYSRFAVGAAVLADDGSIVDGCNVENVSYGLSVCAERAAVHSAVVRGHRRLRVVAVSTGRAGAAPCGACRQVLAEFGVRTVVIDRAGGPEVHELSDLLPHAFRGAGLRVKGSRAFP